jgi:hypothetical protein
MIMDLLKCDEQHAIAVFQEMPTDFSECTKEEFERDCYETAGLIDVDFGFSPNMSTDLLGSIYGDWLNANDLEDVSADEHLMFNRKLSKFQRNWLFQFCEAFKASQAREDHVH